PAFPPTSEGTMDFHFGRKEADARLSRLMREVAPDAAAPTPAPTTAPPAKPAPAAPAAPTPAAPPTPAPPPAAPASPPPAAPVAPASPAPPASAPAAPPASPQAKKEGDDSLAARMQKLESSMANFQELRSLSELLSVKYNPFLEAEEVAIEDLHTPAELVRRRIGEEPAPVAAPPQARPLEASPSAPLPELARPGAAAPLVQPTPPAPVGAALAPAPNFYRGAGFVGGPREAFLAIHWLTSLGQGTDASVLFLYLDHYRQVGWLDAAQHAWLDGLASGLAGRTGKTAWSDYGLGIQHLAQAHLRNLRCLDKIFGSTLQHGEAQYLQQTLDLLLQEG
ncbi:MAG: hypothetical protein QOI63_1402, partial [Thermoplasmata archaeon]|nr:hypothetical protein [Thermoplasmata archaeon]